MKRAGESTEVPASIEHHVIMRGRDRTPGACEAAS